MSPESRDPSHGAEDFAGTDRFLVQRRIGSGAFGVVYEAYDRREKSLVALKVLRFAEADALYRFKKDFRALADIRHPNLVSFFELLSEDGLWFFSMERVPGVDFIQALCGGNGRGPRAPDFDRIRRLVLQLARGLHTVHASGKVHRDIKPPNVLVTGDDRAVLLDFGLVTELSRIGMPEAEPQTVGTPAYMSPEQALALPGSPASDWYSVGVMLYQALAGELPFTGTTLEILTGKQTAAPPPLTGAPADLEELCLGLLDPDPETRMRGDEVLRRLETAGAPAAGAAEPETAFVGRAEILAELAGAFAASRERAVTVYLRGASGMGKTALIERFVARLDAADEPPVVLAGRCYLQETVPYKALDSLIDALSRTLTSLPREEIEAVLPDRVAALARLFPVLLRVGPIAAAESPSLDPRSLRRQAVEGLKQLLARMAARRALVLVIDDLQWGDMDSFLLLDEVLKPPAPPMLLIGAYRSEDVASSPFLRALARKRDAHERRGVDVRELGVGPLSETEARELIGALGVGGRDAREERASGILREAAGNPLFLTELARFSRGRPPAPADGRDADLRDVIRARVETLPPPARRLLEAVAVAGKPLDLAAARAAVDLGSAGAEAVAQLRARKLVRQLAGDGADEIETYHDRIRETVIEGMSARRLRRVHRALAEALESSGRAEPETLAVHFRATEEVLRAREYAVTAAARAEQALAFERAARLYRLALELEAEPGPERYRLRVKLGEALANAGHSREAAETFIEAVGHSGPNDPFEAQRHAAEQLLTSGHVDRGTAILRHVLRTLGLRLPRRSWKALADLKWHRLRLRLRGFRFRETPAAECGPALLQRIDACWSVAIGLCLVDVLRAGQFHARQLLLALSAGEPRRLARGLAMEVFFGALEGAATGEAADLARRLADRRGDRYAAGLTEMASAIDACSQGAWNEACRHLETAGGRLREARSGVAWALDTVRRFRVLAHLHLGRWPALFAELPGLLGTAREQDDLSLELHLRHWVESFRCLVDDRPDAALELLAETARFAPDDAFRFQHLGHLYASAQAALYQGRGAEAWELVSGSWRALERSRLQRIGLVRVLSWDLRARCALAAAAADPGWRGRRLGQAEAAARELERAGSTWAGALAGLARAGAAEIRAGRDAKAEAMTRLEAAAQAFDRGDMPAHAAVARLRLGRLAGDGAAREAERSLRRRGVRDPQRLAAVFAPHRQPL